MTSVVRRWLEEKPRYMATHPTHRAHNPNPMKRSRNRLLLPQLRYEHGRHPVPCSTSHETGKLHWGGERGRLTLSRESAAVSCDCLREL